MDGRSYKNYKIALPHPKVTTTSIYPYLGYLKSRFSSSPVFHSNFIYLPTGIWETTRSRSSLRGYFQISFPCEHCKWTKHYFIIPFIYDPEVSKYLFWHLRVVGRGVMERRWTVDWLPVVWLHLFKLSFFRSLRSLFQSQSSVSI